MRSFDVFFDLYLNKQLSKQSYGWWFEMPLCPLWHHCNVFIASKRFEWAWMSNFTPTKKWMSCWQHDGWVINYSDVIMSMIASRITSLLICLLNGLFRCRSKKTLKLRVIGLCEGNLPVTSEFPTQSDSKVENFDDVICFAYACLSWKKISTICSLGTVSLRLMASQFKDWFKSHKKKSIKSIFCLCVQNFVWNFKCAFWNFTQNF